MMSMVQDGDKGSVETKSKPPAAGNPSRQVGIDVRSRDAFELLKLGEALVNLQGDLRNLRLEKEDLRFDRNRYQASAAQYQSKLTRALDELDQARVYREEAARTRHEVVILAREFEDKLGHARNAAAECNHQFQTLRHEMEELKAGHDRHLQHEVAAVRAELTARYDQRLRQEIVSLAREFETKLNDRADAMEHDKAHEFRPGPRERWKLR